MTHVDEMLDRFGPAEPARRSMRLLITGSTGVIGREFRPLAESAGHHVSAPSRTALDLFDAAAVADATRGIDAVLHLATRIQPLEQLGKPGSVARE